ncbi:MAG: hypothetical protein JXB48_10550 [Candidatus Latescibacteria bacterium]|nr:hypothetical protein [Candidatus Latescibacterota bacterium]
MTIRITSGSIILIILFFAFTCVITSLGILFISTEINIPYLKTPETTISRQNTDPQENSVHKSVEIKYLDTESSKPDLTDLSIARHNNNEMEILFSFLNISDYNKLYIWLIINPDADISSETVIYPRNPIFRGVPVDYRNGIEYFTSEQKEINISITDLIYDIDFKDFRILAYSQDGLILVDKRFSVNKL